MKRILLALALASAFSLASAQSFEEASAAPVGDPLHASCILLNPIWECPAYRNPGPQIQAIPPTPVAPIPEPETYALMLAGLAALGWIARRRKRSP